MVSDSIRVPLHTALRLFLVVWAGFWAWFILAASFGGLEAPPPWWIPVLGLSALALLLVLGWRWPRAGAIALLLAGLAAAAFFDNPWARGLLAAPAVLLGAGLLALSYSTAPGKRAL